MRKSKAQPSVVADAAFQRNADAPLRREDRPAFHAEKSEWKKALWFLLTLSLAGLGLYPVLLLTLVLMIRSWRTDRYHFMMQVLLLMGYYGFLGPTELGRLDILLGVSAICFFLIPKRQPELRRALWCYALYAAVLFAIALTSIEIMTIQIRMMRLMLYFGVFIVPIYMFRDREFSAARFFHVLAVYALVICVFYIIDGMIFRGWVLLPALYSEYARSQFSDIIAMPFAFGYFPRKYPPGLYLLILLIYPLIHYFRFSWKQWLLVLLALITCRTMSLVSALIVAYLMFYGKASQVLKATVIAVVAIVGIFFLDKATGGFLRVASTVEQFTSLEANMDREDLSELGSSRAAQIIPKMELLNEQHREWLGFGFIHPELSKSTAFQLTNDLYSDIEKSDENSTGVEETHFQTILYVGYLGLIAQTLFYFGLYYITRRLPLSKFYLCTLVGVEICGVGGFTNLNDHNGLFLLAWSFAAVILAGRSPQYITKR